jgi:hypothetical protein
MACDSAQLSKSRQAPNCQAKAKWFENRLKAERARFLDRRERRAKPRTEPLLPPWGKSGMLTSDSA